MVCTTSSPPELQESVLKLSLKSKNEASTLICTLRHFLGGQTSSFGKNLPSEILVPKTVREGEGERESSFSLFEVQKKKINMTGLRSIAHHLPGCLRERGNTQKCNTGANTGLDTKNEIRMTQ